MSNYEWDRPVDRFGDAEARYERDLEAEQIEHENQVIRERLYEHRPARPDPKPDRRVPRRMVQIYERWRDEVFERDQYSCQVHLNPADCEWPPQSHHVVTAQLLRRDGHAAALNDRRVGMTVCAKAHRQHHNRTRPILREEVPAEVLAYVYELGYTDWFEKTYPSREAAAA